MYVYLVCVCGVFLCACFQRTETVKPQEKRLRLTTNPHSPRGAKSCHLSWESYSTQNTSLEQTDTQMRGRLKCTSVFCPFHVEPWLIWHEVFRSRFLGSIVQFAEVLTNDVIVTLTRDFFGTPEIAAFMPCNLVRFKSVASEEHSSNGVFRWRLALSSSSKYTNPEHQKRNWEPGSGIHIESNACYKRDKSVRKYVSQW